MTWTAASPSGVCNTHPMTSCPRPPFILPTEHPLGLLLHVAPAIPMSARDGQVSTFRSAALRQGWFKGHQGAGQPPVCFCIAIPTHFRPVPTMTHMKAHAHRESRCTQTLCIQILIINRTLYLKPCEESGNFFGRHLWMGAAPLESGLHQSWWWSGMACVLHHKDHSCEAGSPKGER